MGLVRFHHLRFEYNFTSRINYSCANFESFSHIGIGDIRSRLVRLIPDDGPNTETAAIKAFFNYRLPTSYVEARNEWLEILESTHWLWHGISSPKRELIRSFLNAINLEMLKRLRPSSRFDFSGASCGNLFLTGYVFVNYIQRQQIATKCQSD